METVGTSRTGTKLGFKIPKLGAWILLGAILGSVMTYFVLRGDDGSKEQVAALEAQVVNLEATIAAKPLPTPTAEERAKAAEQERLDNKFIIGIYDEETVTYVTRTALSYIDTFEDYPLGGDPQAPRKAAARLAHYFNYLAEGITIGSVDKSSALSLVTRYEEITNLLYVPSFETQGSSLREAIGRIKFAEPPSSP